MKANLNPESLYWASFNGFELRLPGQAVMDIAQSGANDDAVAHWKSLIKNEWPERCTPDAIRAELKEYGAWDEDQLANDEDNWERVVWLAAWSIAEDDEPDASEPVKD